MLMIVALGLIGGTLGGLLGLGGSVFIIPALVLLLGANQHLYQAAALIANVFVAAAATMRHRGRGTIRPDVVPLMATASAIAALCGVAVSNRLQPHALQALFGVFLCYAAVSEVVSLAYKRAEPAEPAVGSLPRWLPIGTGFVGGFASGLLGIGGGAIMVPMLRKLGKLPIRQAVASAAAAMIVACTIGAIAKNATIADRTAADGTPLTLQSSLLLALLLSPSAMLGGSIGASLVYRLPIPAIRTVLSMLLAFSGYQMINKALAAAPTQRPAATETAAPPKADSATP